MSLEPPCLFSGDGGVDPTHLNLLHAQDLHIVFKVLQRWGKVTTGSHILEHAHRRSAAQVVFAPWAVKKFLSIPDDLSSLFQGSTAHPNLDGTTDNIIGYDICIQYTLSHDFGFKMPVV